MGFDSERTINMFEYRDREGKKPTVNIFTPGLDKVVDLVDLEGLKDVRAQFVFRGFAYSVIGNKVYRSPPNLSMNFLFSMSTSVGYVGIDAAVNQILFVDGQQGYVWDTSDSPPPVNPTILNNDTVPNFPSQPIDVQYFADRFVVPQGNSRDFYISALNDGTTWDSGNRANITTHPGDITAIKSFKNRLFIFSENFTEVWENVGLSDFPLRPNKTLLMEVGTTAIWSVQENFDRLFFLSRDTGGLGPIMMVIGSVAIPISTTALDYVLQNFNNTNDATSFVYRIDGCAFYKINFTEDNRTFVYNITFSSTEEPLWHEEAMLDGSRHVAQTHIYFNEKNYVGHYQQPIIYEVNDSFVDNAGEAIKRTRISRVYSDENYQKIRVDRFKLDLVQGQVEDVTTNDPPLVFLSLSIDGGQTYGSEHALPMGGIGDTTYRTIARKLGTGRALVFKVEFYDKIKFSILGASWDFEILPE